MIEPGQATTFGGVGGSRKSGMRPREWSRTEAEWAEREATTTEIEVQSRRSRQGLAEAQHVRDRRWSAAAAIACLSAKVRFKLQTRK
ncbi:Transmembrane protein [Sesbania bispinosa]|nr:Transmembrane protein [Sesbania bispinosa]